MTKPDPKFILNYCSIISPPRADPDMPNGMVEIQSYGIALSLGFMNCTDHMFSNKKIIVNLTIILIIFVRTIR